jgi:hypothetical protein
MKVGAIAVFLLVLTAAVPALAADRGDGENSVDAGSILISGESRLLLGLTRGNFGGNDYVANTTGFDLGARGGYFVIDGLAVGGRLRFGYELTETDVAGDDNKFATYTVDLLPGARYYFLHDKWYKPFVGAEIGLRYRFGDGEDFDTSAALLGLSAGGGVALFLIDQVSLDFGLNVGYFFGSVVRNPNPGPADTYGGGMLDFNLGAAVSAYF